MPRASNLAHSYAINGVYSRQDVRYLVVERPSPDTAGQSDTPTRFDTGTSPQALFGFRIWLHRKRRRLTLDQIAAATCVRRELLEGLEHNDLSNWPRGLYARAWVRQYASLVGLDPEETVDEFCRLFPHGDRRASAALREIGALISQPSEYRDEPRDTERRRVTSPLSPRRSARPATPSAARNIRPWRWRPSPAVR